MTSFNIGSKIQYKVGTYYQSYIVLGYNPDRDRLILGRTPSFDLGPKKLNEDFAEIKYLQFKETVQSICPWKCYYIDAIEYNIIYRRITGITWEYASAIKSYFKDQQILTLPNLYD